MVLKRSLPVSAIMLAIGLIGLCTVLRTHAFVPHAAVEAEAGATRNQASVIQDTTASGGGAVRFASIANIGGKGFGMSVPLLPSQTAAVQDTWLADMHSLGITWVRIDIDWWAVQPDNASSYDWSKYDTVAAEAKKYGIKIDGIIDYTTPWARDSSCAQSPQCQPADPSTYATYAKAVVQHFGNLLGAVEIWNEPNTGNFWLPRPNPAAYAALLTQAYAAIKSANPHMLVISAGLAPAATDGTNYSPVDFLSGVYAAGAKNSFDAVGAHPYSYPALPSQYEPWSGWSMMNDTSPSMRSVMTANGDSAKHIWMTETGAPTGGPNNAATCSTAIDTWSNMDHDDDCLQAKNYSDIITLSKSFSWSGVTFFYSYKDDGTDTGTVENFFGIIRADGSKKPSYTTLQQSGL